MDDMSTEEKQDTESGADPGRFQKLLDTLDGGGVAAAIDCLIETLEGEKQFPQLFEALLMKKRHQLGLPIEGSDSIRDIPEEHREEVEEYYVEVCRIIGGHFLAEGRIGAAWPYFRAIDDSEQVAAAISSWEPPRTGASTRRTRRKTTMTTSMGSSRSPSTRAPILYGAMS